jgi:hypothetical protein
VTNAPYFRHDPSHYKRFAMALEAMQPTKAADIFEISANIERFPTVRS